MKISTYPTLSGYVHTYQRLKAVILLALFSFSILPALAQTNPPLEVRLQPGETAVRQITVTNSGSASVSFQTAVKESTASLAQRNVAPASFDGLDVVFSTGFEDYTIGNLGDQMGWDDLSPIVSNNVPVIASVSTESPLSGGKHLDFNIGERFDNYLSVSPQVEPEQTSAVRSLVFNFDLTGSGSDFRLFAYKRRDPRFNGSIPDGDAGVAISSGGKVAYFDNSSGSGNRVSTPFGDGLEEGYVEVMIVANQITKTYDLYVDGQRVAEQVGARHGLIEGLLVVQLGVPVTGENPSLYFDDLTIAEGDASAPDWISTPTASGTLPTGESTLDVALDAQNLAPGTYEAEVQVLDEAFGSVTTVPITLVVEEPPVVVVIENLNLSSVCSDDPDEELRWRIRNPNDFDVEVTWQVYGSAQADTVVAAPGDSFFFTQTEVGANTTTIRWKDENGQTKQRTKASGKEPCQPVVAQPKLLAYPTIIENELTLEIDGAGNGKLFIFSERYALIYRAKVAPGTNLVLGADELRLQSGVTYYILLAIPGPNGWAIRKQTVLKQ